MLETASSGQLSVPGRIDRLPMTRELAFIMLLAGFAWLIESYDIGIVGNILPLLEREYALTPLELGLLPTASTLGIVIALIPAGRLADAIGRKRVLVVGTTWYALLSLLAGFAPNVPAIIGLRFLAGLGMGAVFPIPYALATEFMPSNRRGAMVGILDSFLSFGYFLAPLLSFFVTQFAAADVGWRYLFFVGGLPLLYVPVMLRWMPESPRWLQVKGRDDEADEIVRHLERQSEQHTGKKLPASMGATPPTPSHRPRPQSFATIFQREYLTRTLMMWVAFSCILAIFYAIQTFTPTVLVKEGFGLANAFLLTTIIVLASIPGKYLAAFAVERFGRKPTLICFTVLAALSAVFFGFLPIGGLALFFATIMSFFGIGVDPVVKVYGAEQYPTAIRETGVGFFESVGRLLGGVVTPWIIVFLLANGGITSSYIFVAVVAIIGAVAVAALGRETKGIIADDVVLAAIMKRSV